MPPLSGCHWGTQCGKQQSAGGPLWPHAPYPQRPCLTRDEWKLLPGGNGSQGVGERTVGLGEVAGHLGVSREGISYARLDAEQQLFLPAAARICVWATVCWLGCCRPSHCYQVLQWKVQTPT